MRFTNVILAYFVIGVVMFGGGAIDYQDSGVSTFFVETNKTTTAAGGNNSTTLKPSAEAESGLSAIGGAIGDLVGQFLGAIQLVYNLIVGLLGFLNWPIIVLLGVNAPPLAVLLIGGTFSAAFYLSVIRLIQQSA